MNRTPPDPSGLRDDRAGGEGDRRRRADALRRVSGVGAALLLVLVVAAVFVPWAQGWSERGWLGYLYQRDIDSDLETLGPLTEIWMLRTTSFQVLRIFPDPPADRAGLTTHDRVVSIDGVATHDVDALRRLDARLGGGDEVVVELERGGELRRVAMRFESPWASPLVVVTAAASVGAALFFLLPGLVVFWARPRAHTPIVFSLLCACGSVLLATFIFFELAMSSPRGVLPTLVGDVNWAVFCVCALASLLMTSLLLHLGLIFPRRRPIVERWPQVFHWLHAAPFLPGLLLLALTGGLIFGRPGWRLALTFALAAAIALPALVRLRRAQGGGVTTLRLLAAHPYASFSLLAAAAFVAGPLLRLTPDGLKAILFALLLILVMAVLCLVYPITFGVLTLVSLVRSYRESGVEEKRQVRWPLWGLGVALVGSFLLLITSWVMPQVQPEILGSAHFHAVMTILTRLVYLPIPVAFAFAIAKYRLMDVDLLVRKTAVYAATTALVVGAYFAVVGLLGVALVSWFDLDSPVVAVGATLLVVALFVPLRNRIQRLVDRRFRRDGFDRREALESIRRAVLAAADLDGLLPRIAETVQQALQSRAVVLFVRPPERSDLVARAKVGVPDEVVGRLRVAAGALAAAGRVADRADLPFDEETQVRLKRHRLHCLAPARRQGAVVGAVAVADSLSGDAPSADDREFLAAAADQLALAVGTLGPRRESVELDDARRLQRSLLPAVLPQPPGVDLAGAWHPAREVAGDYYEAIDLGGGRLALCIGDVVGKGMPAALLMSSLQAAVRAVATADTPPHRLCEQVRRVVTANLAGGRFVTFFYALYDAGERRLAYTNAGHVPPLLVRRDGVVERLEGGGGAFVRLLADAPFSSSETTLARGDRLLLFTDGVNEAQAPDGALYGEQRLAALLAADGEATATALAERITADVRAHAAGDPADDLTLLLLRAT